MVGLALVGAMGFTFTQMVRHRETVAALAGGISLRRLAMPVMVVAAIMMGLKFIDQEFILSNPRIAPLLARDHGDAGNREWSASAVPPTADGSRRVFMAREFLPKQSRLLDLHVWERDQQGILTRHVAAAAAEWREGAWELEGARELPVGLAPSGSDVTIPPEGVASGRVDGTAAGAAVAGGVRIATDLDPAALLLRRDSRVVEALSWRQIGAMLASPKLDPTMRDKLVRVKWGRISIAISTFLSLMITMPFFLVREPRNMLVQSLKCAPVGIFALLGSVFGASAPVPGLPVVLAVFLPVLVLIPITIASWTSVRT
jgi:lipopolysaccharide export LptBFGC system permease protein LptF